jgi:hypothetical protein
MSDWTKTEPGWTGIELKLPTRDRRLYRYSAERRATGRPVKVQVYYRGEWRDCPNVDVSDAIMKAAGLGQ